MYSWSCFWTIYCLWPPQIRNWHLQGILWYIFFRTKSFLINAKKSVLQPCQTLQFLGMEINLVDMTLTLQKEKKKIVQQCQDLLGKSLVSIEERSPCIHSNCSSASTFAISRHAATTNYRTADNWGLRFTNNHIHGGEGRTELVGTKPLLDERKSNNFSNSSPNSSCWYFCKRTGGAMWSELGDHGHDFSTSLISMFWNWRQQYLAILTFTYMHPIVQSILLQIDNIAALSHLVKIGAVHSQILSDISK